MVLSALQVKADETVRGIRPDKRRCYFKDENPLKMHRDYSQSNCILECHVEYARKEIQKRYNNTNGCVPWFYPVNDNYVAHLCDPWQTRKFQEFMKSMPDDLCDYCYPDCDTTIYDSSISTAPFRACDHTNLGVSKICNLITGDMNPPMWTQTVVDEYQNLNPTGVPDFAQPNPKRMSNMRRYASKEKLEVLAFRHKNIKSPRYDAFERDIAVVTFYYAKQTVTQYQKSNRMTWMDYMSKVCFCKVLTMFVPVY